MATALCREFAPILSLSRQWPERLDERGLGQLEREVGQHRVQGSGCDGFVGEAGLRDAVQAKGARRLPKAAPRGQVPAATRAHQPGRLDDPPRFARCHVPVGQLDGDGVQQRLLEDGGDRVRGTAARPLGDPNVAHQLRSAVPGRAGHGAGELLERRVSGLRKRHSARGGQSRGDSGRLGGREVQGWQARVRVQRVPAARPGLGPDWHASFLERQQIALDGACGDFEPLGQLTGPHQPRRSRAQLVHERVQPIGAVHSPSLGTRPLRLRGIPRCSAAFLGQSITSSLADGDQSKKAACRPNFSHGMPTIPYREPNPGGPEGTRTPGLVNANDALSRLSYRPPGTDSNYRAGSSLSCQSWPAARYQTPLPVTRTPRSSSWRRVNRRPSKRSAISGGAGWEPSADRTSATRYASSMRSWHVTRTRRLWRPTEPCGGRID